MNTSNYSNSTLAIIGTAGRKDDKIKLLDLDWSYIKKQVIWFVENNKISKLISGGAAYADHLAVELYLQNFVKQLHLALPCSFNSDKGLFEGNDGGICNYYHIRQKQNLGYNTLEQIKDAINKGCQVTVKNGFFARNNVIAQYSDVCLAITFGDGKKIKSGGTNYTAQKFIEFNKSNQHLYHLDLNTNKIYRYAEV